MTQLSTTSEPSAPSGFRVYFQTLTMEFRKYFSTRTWWALLLVTLAWVAMNLATMVLAVHFGGSDMTEQDGMSMPKGDDLARLLYSMGTTLGFVFPAIVGAMSVAGEYRHQTLTPTLLADPVRWRVLAAKFVSAVPLGALYAVAVIVGCLAFGAAPLALLGDATALGSGQTWEMFARMVLAMVLWGLVGVGLGTLITNQMAAIVTLLGITMFLEPTLRAIPMLIGRDVPALAYLPGALGDGVTGESLYSMLGENGVSLLSLGPAVLGLVVYAVVLLVAGYFLRFRRDVH
ncbi:MAG: ABC transporter permease [Cellulomonas sp.]|jgi:ABC-type transport system involved in multi-copper enzyme maturation permease subunit|nr:ABC transporter permease [Cellulomonas sp.]